MITESIISGAAEGIASVVVKTMLDKWLARYRKATSVESAPQGSFSPSASGLDAYLERSFQRCRFFKTLLNTSQPLEVEKKYVHTFLKCGSEKTIDDTLIKNSEIHRSVVVTGLAGSGKSMFMKYLTLQKFQNSNGIIPLFIELRHLNGLTNKNLLTFIKSSCLSPGYSISDKDFRSTLGAGGFIVILDGFD